MNTPSLIKIFHVRQFAQYMARPIDVAFPILKNEAYDWQGQEFDTRCPKCGKGIYREDEDDLFAIREMGECLDCLTQPTTDTNP